MTLPTSMSSTSPLGWHITPVPAVTLWLTVYESADMMGSGGTLYWRRMETPFAPTMDATIALFHRVDDEYGDEDWGHRSPKRIYWDHDGSVHVEMIPYQIDPNEQMRVHCDGVYRSPWWSQDGDLHAHCRDSGWLNYSEVKP